MNERRQGVRVPLDVSVSEELISGYSKAKTLNISSSGMRYSKPAGAACHGSKEVFLEFNLPGQEEPVRVLGWVVEEIKKNDALETAITFMFLQENDEKKILAHVENN